MVAATTIAIRGRPAMNRISRRQAFASLLAAACAVPAASLLLGGSARADTPGPSTPDTKPGAPRTHGLRAQLTPGDREMNRKCINKTMTEAPTGATWKWNNPKTGNGGTVTPTTPPTRHSGEVCRDFTETLTLKDGRTETVNGRACRKADGSWSIVA